MAETLSREIHLKSRPSGMPEAENFELVEVSVPEPADGELLVRNIYMSVDPYMRGRMVDRKSYVPPFQIGQPLDGGCVGRVVRSRNNAYAVGDYVLGTRGWREYYTSEGSQLQKIDPALAPVQTYLGVMGMPGLTAYVGLLDVGRARPGDMVFVSAAAGAVGSAVCQIAKIKGCRVVGSAGSREKIRWLLEEAGIDAAFNYKETDKLTEELHRHCPKPIDVYYDNVGGSHLEAALDHMNDHGRIVLCGMISQYNSIQRPRGPGNLFLAIQRRLTLQGFIVSDYLDRVPQFHQDLGKWIKQGRIKWRETVVEGIERAPEAFIGLFRGDNFGKMLVKVGPDPAV